MSEKRASMGPVATAGTPAAWTIQMRWPVVAPSGPAIEYAFAAGATLYASWVSFVAPETEIWGGYVQQRDILHLSQGAYT